MVKTNDLKKGTEVRLYDGQVAVIMDNRRGNIRRMKVPSLFRPGTFEICDNYAHHIIAALVDGEWHGIELTDSQKNLGKMGW